MSDNVHQFKVSPKVSKIKHRNHVITIRYDPVEKTWHYEFAWTPDPIKFSGSASTEAVAVKRAMKAIDKCLGPK